MNGMLPNQEISRILTGDREREVRKHVSQSALTAAAKTADPAPDPELGTRRPRLPRLHLLHHGHAVRTVVATAAALGSLSLVVALLPAA